MIFDMRKDKMLFVFERYKYNDNKILTLKNLSFLSIISFIIIIRSLKFIVKNELKEDNFDINSSKDIKKRSTSIFKTFKKEMIQKLDLLNIVEIDALIYYYLARNKKKQAFFFNNK